LTYNPHILHHSQPASHAQLLSVESTHITVSLTQSITVRSQASRNVLFPSTHAPTS
jgi:hypothetical protein